MNRNEIGFAIVRVKKIIRKRITAYETYEMFGGTLKLKSFAPALSSSSMFPEYITRAVGFVVSFCKERGLSK